MATISIEQTITVEASAADIWKIVGEDFASIHTWATDVAGSRATDDPSARLDGASVTGRSCSLDGFGDTDERLVAFDPDARTLAYTVSARKIPGFVQGMRNDWSIVSTSPEVSEVTAHVTAEARGIMGAIAAPVLRMKLRGAMTRVLADMKVFAEGGVVSDAKRKRLAKQ